LVFNFWEAENLLFLIFNISGATGTQMKKGNCIVGFSSGEHQREKDRRKKSHKGRKGVAHAAKESGRLGPTI
jgi:hypothetical protein